MKALYIQIYSVYSVTNRLHCFYYMRHFTQKHIFTLHVSFLSANNPFTDPLCWFYTGQSAQRTAGLKLLCWHTTYTMWLVILILKHLYNEHVQTNSKDLWALYWLKSLCFLSSSNNNSLIQRHRQWSGLTMVVRLLNKSQTWSALI